MPAQLDNDLPPTSSAEHGLPADAIVIVGLAGRFPGAPDVDTFWDNLRAGRESIVRLSQARLRAAGVPDEQQADPRFVPAGALLDDVDCFDAEFFGLSPRDAALTDPQHRIFMECAWSALEDAGHVPDEEMRIGVFAGAGLNSYLVANLLPNPGIVAATGTLALAIANKADFMPSRLSYRLGLTGPSLNVGTACSTSLVAVHAAARALQGYECDVAVAGGVTVELAGDRGYLHQAGGVLSASGHCRAFDAAADGMVCGSGAGAVALMRLEDALAGGYRVYAVIKGSAVNNDGAAKAGYTAPGVAGQCDVIATALGVAEVDPATIGYVEAHGTGTVVGDPIEVRALTEAFRSGTSRTGFCALGSVKPNIGHLDTAAGVAGLIKTTLCVHHGELVPSIGYDTPNPAIDFDSTPFKVNTRLLPWRTDAGLPRRAGVSSFGIGGTNAHVVLEQAPVVPASLPPARPWQLLPLSARTPAALERVTDRLAAHLERQDISADAAGAPAAFADVAFTLQRGRRAFRYRRAVVAQTGAEAAQALRRAAVVEGEAIEGRKIVFMFPGIGDQYVGMGRALYKEEAVFRAVVDEAAQLLRPILGRDLRELLQLHAEDQPASPAAALDLRALLRGAASGGDALDAVLRETRYAHPALFVIEYATARLVLSWGVRPAALIGHSLGEYTAACLAGVIDFADALRVVAQRAALIDALPKGRMLAVAAPADSLRATLPHGLSLAADNAPQAAVVAGDAERIAAYAETLKAQGIVCLPVASDHAFHSTCLEPVRPALAALLRSVPLRAPAIPCISNLTGTWMTAGEATDPLRWAEHSCATVAFAAGVASLRAAGHDVFLELGPGQTLGSFVQQHGADTNGPAEAVVTVQALAGPHERGSARDSIALALAALWCAGAWDGFTALHGNVARRRVTLPTYPFERQRHWIDAPATGAGAVPAAAPIAGEANADAAPQLLACRWTQAPLPLVTGWPRTERWLVFGDDGELAAALCERLRTLGQSVAVVRAGWEFARTGQGEYLVAPGRAADYDSLARRLQADGAWPDRIVHLWGLTGAAADADVEAALTRGYASVTALGRALQSNAVQGVSLLVVSDGVQSIDGSETIAPAKAAVLGPCRVLPLEMPHLAVAHLDLRAPRDVGEARHAVDAVLHELALGLPQDSVACRGRWRWSIVRDALQPDAAPLADTVMRPGARVLIANYGSAPGARALAADIVRRTGGPLDLICDQFLPPRSEWIRVTQAAETPAALRDVLNDLLALEAQGACLDWFASAGDDAGALAAWLAARPHPDLAVHLLPLPLPQLIATQEPGAAAELQAVARRADTLAAWLAQAQDGAALFVAPLAAAAGQVGLAATGAAAAVVDAIAERLRLASGRPVVVVGAEIREAAAHRDGTLAARTAAARGRHALTDDVLARTWPAWLRTDAARVETSAGDPRTLRALLRRQTVAALSDDASGGHARGLRPSYQPAENDFEGVVIDLWEDLFGIRPIGRHDHFFALGGSSLLAVQFISRVREVYDVELGLAAVFRAPTVSALAEVLEALLLAELEGMDEAEAERELAGTQPPSVLLSEPTDLRLPGGLVVRQFNPAETEHFYHDIFVEQVYTRHGIVLHDDAVVFDVGANVGLFSLFVQQRCPAARLVAFEPAPAVFAALQANLRSHGVRAEALNCGVGAHSGRRPLTFYPLSTGMSSFHADHREEREVLHAVMYNQWRRGGGGMDAVMEHVDELLDQRLVGEVVDCEIRTLSDIIDARGIERIDLVKIDVQKCELEVLEGIAPRHWPRIRQVVIEVHDLDGRVARIGDLLQMHGFHVTVQQELLYQSSNISIMYGKREKEAA